MSKPTIYYLIPTHNRVQILKQCLDSIQKQTYPNIQTIVVDDGSTDSTPKILKKYPVTVLKGDGNLWWTGAMRLGVDHILKQAREGDYIMLMNDDTTFKPNFTKILLDLSQKHPDAIITSLSFSDTKQTQLVEAGVKIDWTNHRYDQPLKLPSNYKKLTLQPVDATCGRGTIVPIKVFKKIGNFSPFLPHYHADYEFTIRAKKAGFSLYIAYPSITFATLEAGGVKFSTTKKTWSKFNKELFSRRSKVNLIDQLALTFLSTPNKYKSHRLKTILIDLIFRLSLTSFFFNLRRFFNFPTYDS